MHVRGFAVLLLISLPTLAEGQRRTRGEPEADWKKIQEGSSRGPSVKDSDIEAMSGVRILVDKRKDLKLSDAQVAQLRDLLGGESQATKPRFDTIDSLRNAIKSRPGSDPDIERARTSIARQELMRTIVEVREAYDSNLAKALPLLDDAQRGNASTVVQKERADADENLREKLGGGFPRGQRPDDGKVPFEVRRLPR